MTAWKKRLLGSALAGVGGLLAWGFLVEPNWPRLKRETFYSPRLPEEFEGYRIGIAADFHHPQHSTKRQIRRAGSLLASAEPHVILLLGDIEDRDDYDKDPESVFGVFDDYKAPDGVFGCVGNHDHHLDIDKVVARVHADSHIRMLVDEGIAIHRDGADIALIGLDDKRDGDPDFNKAFSRIDDEVFRIAMMHSPQFADTFPERHRVDLQVSGHTHGGQVRLIDKDAPVVIDDLPQKFREGWVEGERHPIFVTRGVASSFHFRLNCRPEVVLLTLHRGGDSSSMPAKSS